MVIEPVLKLPEFDKPFSVETFASGRGAEHLWERLWRQDNPRGAHDGKRV